ncbi:MAG: TonB-dependent receptor, partial [Flavobacterium sp.]
MNLKKYLLFCFLLLCQLICAQNDSINRLDEVEVSDRQLQNFSNTQTVTKLNDSVLRRNRPSLTALLNYNSTIYFKEYGPGMVSSPSFRGTSAQQTAVIWNGININSQFNGQTDFNTITATDFDNIAIRAGGGSVLYGSSAIGGSIHLNSALRFGKRFENDVRAEFGSFNTIGFNYKVTAGTEKFAVQASVSRNSSNNDFELPSGRRNANGKFYNTSYNTVIGFRIDQKNSIKWFSYAFDGNRHFSLISPSDTKT